MGDEEGFNWVVPGALLLILVVIAALLWASPPRSPPGPSWQRQSYLEAIPLASGHGPGDAERIARDSGFVVLTNAVFNDLIPAGDRSGAFSNTTVFQFRTRATNDIRYLAIPAAGSKCFLFISCWGEVETVQTIQRDIDALKKKL